MFRNISKLGLVAAFLFIAACSSTPDDESDSTNLDVKVKAPNKNSSTGEDNNAAGNTGGNANQLVGSSEWGDDNNAWGSGYSIDYLRSLGIDRNPVEYDTVYFPYNSSELGERGKIIVEAHSLRLQTYGATKVVLEGHADERGTREYNLALGEKRGQSVQDMMNAIGTGSSGLQVVSFGEERPVVLDQNEDAWRANRRVQILY